MFCANCGKKVKEKSKFCSNCGKSIINSKEINDFDNNGISHLEINNNNIGEYNKEQNSGVVIAALVIGIISIILSFIIGPFVIPLSIIGFCLGIINKDKSAMKITSVLLNSISAIIGIFMIIIFGSFLLLSLIAFENVSNKEKYVKNDNPVSGFWDCKLPDDSVTLNDYKITFNLEDDGNFSMYENNDRINNYAYGKYSYEELHKNNQSHFYKYYKIKLIPTDYVLNGEKKPNQFTLEYEIGINDDEDEAYLINSATSKMYYCFR